MEVEEYNFGTISYDRIISGSLKVLGASKNIPRLVSKVDESIWVRRWDERGSMSGFSYLHNRFSFGADLGAGVLKMREIWEVDRAMRFILERYNFAAVRYNDLIARPLESIREKLIRDITND